MCAETQNLEMALPSCQGTAFLSHPLCKSLTERGKRRKEVTDALNLQWGESESPGSSQRWSSACMCSRLPTSPGRGHGRAAGSAGSWGALQGCSAGMPWHAGAACSTGVPQLGLPGRDDAQLAQVVLPKQTLTSQEMASHHLRAVAWAALCLLVQSRTKDVRLPFLCLRKDTNTHKNPVPGLNIFPLVLSTDLWCAGSGEVYAKLSLPFIFCTAAKNKVQSCSAKDANSLKQNESLACSCCYK